MVREGRGSKLCHHRQSREYYERAVELGSPGAETDLHELSKAIPQVTTQRELIVPSLRSSLVRDLTLPNPGPRVLLPSLTRAAVYPHGQAGGDPRHEPGG